MKQLKELTRRELYDLFPITLVPYKENYKVQFESERHALYGLFHEDALFIEHIGSTAIPTILSKPIVDILLILDKKIDKKDIIEKLTNQGYLLMSEKEKPFQLSFSKGYTIHGYSNHVYHLHVRYEGLDEVYFRDALLRNPNLAKTYEALKVELLKKHPKDRDQYTMDKTFFVSLITEIEKSR